MKRLAKWVLALFGVFILIAMFGPDPDAASGDGTTTLGIEPGAPAEPIERLTARELARAYSENEVAADARFKGRVWAVDGEIVEIAKDIFGKPFVLLGVGARFEGIQCYFGSEAESALAQLRKGQRVTIVGEVDGKAVLNVLLRGSRIAQ